MIDQFQSIGRDLLVEGIITSHGGNMSARVGDRMLITRRGAMLGRLTARDVVETGIEEDDFGITLASSEIGVHREIYRCTSALAIMHAHPPHAVALSLVRDDIIPLDSEASYLLRRVPVLSFEKSVGSDEMAVGLGRALGDYKVVVVRGHGSFATGGFLEEAYQWTSALEASCRITFLTMNAGGQPKEYRKGSERYGDW